jgi:CheY-like chemotaxis protein
MSDDRKRKILLIDDDASLRRTLSDFLRFEGYDVVTAESGEKGLEALDSMIPDLIILDMSMPGMGGIGFLKEIMDSDGVPAHPVLVLTARSNMAEFFADVNVDGFIAKPCDPQDLLMEVSRIIFLRSGDELDTSPAQDQKRYRLLLGEGELAAGRRLREWFSARSFAVEVVEKGPEVLERAIVSRPDVIILNQIMEGMNGDAVVDMLGVMPNTKDIPVILYDNSGMKLPEKGLRASGGGIAAVVESNEPSDIQAAVDKILGSER